MIGSLNVFLEAGWNFYRIRNLGGNSRSIVSGFNNRSVPVRQPAIFRSPPLELNTVAFGDSWRIGVKTSNSRVFRVLRDKNNVSLDRFNKRIRACRIKVDLR